LSTSAIANKAQQYSGRMSSPKPLLDSTANSRDMRHEQMEDNGVVYGNDALLKEIETLMKRLDAANNERTRKEVAELRQEFAEFRQKFDEFHQEVASIIDEFATERYRIVRNKFLDTYKRNRLGDCT
jgi:uncharacterized coiled-coil DUF342 family protein